MTIKAATDSTESDTALPRAEVRGQMLVEWDVPVTMDDGLVLRADVYRPVDGRPGPAIMSYGPYAKGMTFEGGYPDMWNQLVDWHPEVLEGTSGRFTAWELLDPEKWVPDGYVLVRVDSRGAGRSPGVVDVWGPRETQDYYDCIEWTAAQPWCSGKVGLSGVSYFAKNQWQVAAQRPPHLAAICPWEGSNDFYREMARHGGIKSSFLEGWWPWVERVQHGVGSRSFLNPESGLHASGDHDLSSDELAANRADLPGELAQHPFDDAWHQERTARVEDIEVPLLSATNWGGLGLHQRGNISAWASAGSGEKYLEIHGGTHWEDYYTVYGQTLQRRFFDWYLKGEGDWESQPPVLLNVRHADGTFVQRGEQEWPLARSQWRRMYVDGEGGRLADEPLGEISSRTYASSSDGVTLTTAPLERETEFTGPVAAKLWISSSTEDADLFLTLRAFAPDGAEVLFSGANDPKTPLSQGWLRASHRAIDPEKTRPWAPVHPHRESEPLTPGDVYEVDVELWATCIVLPPGYRLALTIAGRDFDHGLEPTELAGVAMRGSGLFVHDDPEDRPAETFDNQVTVFCGGERASYLLVPEISE